jgi:hypothetical protein
MCSETITVDLSNYSETDVLEIKDWLQRSNVVGLIVNEKHQTNKQALGPEWIPILEILITSTIALAAVVQTVLAWKEHKKKTEIVVIIKGDGTQFEVDENNEQVKQLLNK